METRNITLNLPTDLIRKAKSYAAEHDTTINSWVRDLLTEVLTRESRTRMAANRLLALDRMPDPTSTGIPLRRAQVPANSG